MMSPDETLRFRDSIRYGSMSDQTPGDFLDKIEWLCEQYVRLDAELQPLRESCSDMTDSMAAASELLEGVGADLESVVTPDQLRRMLTIVGRIEQALEHLQLDD